MAKSPTAIISHWYTLLENLQTSSQAFYDSVEGAIIKRQMPDIKVSRIDWQEGGLFSAKREYLRIRRKEYTFDICGAPFGKGFFVSWWLGENQSGITASILQIPVIGPLFHFLVRPFTYFKMDTALMFQQAVHAAVLEVVDDITKVKGLRMLSDLDRKPILKEFYRK